MKNITGKRIEVISDIEDARPILKGEQGTVVCVDDIGTVHVAFDSGRQLGLIPDVDEFKVL